MKKDFKLMVLGQIISILGSSLLRFALSLYVLDITGRADLFATLFAVSNIPLLLAPLGGAVADRFNRRNLMVIYDFTSSFIVGGMFALMAFDRLSIVMIGAAMVLLSIVSAMYTPTVTASIPLIVTDEKIESANGIVSAVQALSGVAAPILGGALYKIMGVNTLVVISGLAFFGSAVMEMFIRIPFTKRAQEGGMVRTIIVDLKGGFGYVIKKSFILKATILAALLNMILTPLLVVGAPIILRVTMGSSDTMYGIGMGIIQFASIAGALGVGLFAKKLQMKTVFRWILVICVLLLPVCLSVLPIALGDNYHLSFICFMVGLIPISAILTLLSVFLISKVQKVTPNENLGKVMAIIMGAAQCTTPLGQFIYGGLFETFKAEVYVPIGLVCLVLAAVAAIAKLGLRNEPDIA